jgi:transcriptional regulator with XRE-family HTH domain
MADFAERLKELRKAKGVTQRQMADMLGIAERNYQRYETGAVDPTASNTMKIADFFEVPTDYLLGRDNYWQDQDGHVNVKMPPNILGTTDKDLAEMERKAKEKFEKSVKVRKKK